MPVRDTPGAASLIPTLRRFLVSPDEMDHQVRRRALQAFVEHEVFATRERTGVLLILSLFERRVVVLGDAGINAKVQFHITGNQGGDWVASWQDCQNYQNCEDKQ